MFSISFETLKKEEKPLGKGGFGIVYKCTYHGAPAAIKQLHMDNLSPEAEEEFSREAKTMAELRHPNIVQFYGYCTIPKSLVMEYMPKGSLFQVLHNKKESLDWPVRMRIATEMVCGLAYLHSGNILHRDIKSLNVLLDEQYKAKLTDFGLSRVKKETKSKKIVQESRQDVGTVQWMAPELFSRKGVYTQKSDIYSLGITFWELASRKIPYAEDTQEAIPTFVQQGEREDIPQGCPEKLAYLIQQCWANDPSARPSAPEIAEFLTTDAKTLQEVQALSKGVVINSAGYQVASQGYQLASPGARTFMPQDKVHSAPVLPQAQNQEPAAPVLPVTAPAALDATPKRRGSNILNLADKKEEQEKTRHVLETLRNLFSEERDEGEQTENYTVYNEYLKKAHPDARLVYKQKQNKHVLIVHDEDLEPNAAAREISKMLKSLASATMPAANSQPGVSSGTAMLIQLNQALKPAPVKEEVKVKADDLKLFLRLVAEGEQDKAEAMLKNNPPLACVPGDVTDLSKRTFNNITGFQYAVWALDWHMWTMIRKYLPDNEAKQQAEGFETGAWVKEHGVDARWILNKLLEAYETTIALCKKAIAAPFYKDKEPWKQAHTAWVQQVGGAQLILPAHVINEFCHPSRRFDPVPDFTKLEASGAWRTRTTDEGEWFSAKYGGGTLGEGFAVRRGSFGRTGWAAGVYRIPGDFHVGAARDEAAVAALLKTRASQRAAVAAQYLPESARRVANA